MDDKEKAVEGNKAFIKSKEVDLEEINKKQSDFVDKTHEPKQRKSKKVIYGIVIALVFLIVCIVLYAFLDQQRKQEILDGIQIVFVEDLEIEYGEQEFDFSQLIKEKSDEVTLPDKIDTMILGEKEVIFTVQKEGLHKVYSVKVKVTDTKAPEIALKEDVVTLEYESDFDIKENIESVEDPVDGDISYTEDKTITKDGYYITSDIKFDMSGKYSVKVIAFDKNGNKSEKEFIIDVSEQEKALSTNQGNSNTNSANINDTQKTQKDGITSPSSNQKIPPRVDQVICPNGKEPLDSSLPCDAVTSGAWDQADPKIQFNNSDAAYNHGWNLLVNDRDYSSNYRDFTIAPCQRNDTSTFYVITPSK